MVRTFGANANGVITLNIIWQFLIKHTTRPLSALPSHLPKGNFMKVYETFVETPVSTKSVSQGSLAILSITA